MSHVAAKSLYFQVSFMLGILLLLTVTASQFDLGPWNVPIALAIAAAKAVLIVFIFMHLRDGSPLLRLFAAGGFLWLLILFVLLAADVLYRG